MAGLHGFHVATCDHCGGPIGMGDCVTVERPRLRRPITAGASGGPYWMIDKVKLHRACEEPWRVVQDVKRALRG